MKVFLFLISSCFSIIVCAQLKEYKIKINGNWTQKGTKWNASIIGELYFNSNRVIIGGFLFRYINIDEKSINYFNQYVSINTDNENTKIQRRNAEASEYVKGIINDQFDIIELSGFKKFDPAGIIALDDYKIQLKSDGTFIGNGRGNENKWDGIIEGKFSILETKVGSIDHFISYNKLELYLKQTGNRTEKWMLLHKNNPTFTFVFEDSLIQVFNRFGNKITLKSYNKRNTFGSRAEKENGEPPNYSFFLDESYPQERLTGYMFEYITPYKIKMNFTQNWRDFLGYSQNKQEYYLIKDLKDENELAISKLERNGIVYRTEFKNGKIGDDYVPEITSSFNAGKVYNVGGVRVQEEDYQRKVVDGGYSKDIMGYTSIYQLINKSSKIFLLNYTLSGTSKMTDIVKNRKWFSLDKYKTDVIYSDFDYTKTIILKPNEAFKDQLIVGTEIPINYSLYLNDIIEISNDWLNNLNNALNGSNLRMAYEFAKDDLARKYFSKMISENISNLKLKQIQISTDSYKKFITISLKPKDEILFDRDFLSDVETKIVNNYTDKLKIKYETAFGVNEVFVDPKKFIVVTNSIKGIDRINLKAKILTIEKAD